MFFVLLTAHGDQRTEQNSRGETSYHHISYTYICIYDEHANPLSCHFLPFIIIWLLVIKVVYLICPKFQKSIESVEIFTLLKLLVEAYQYHLMWPWALYAMHLWLCTDSPSINIFPFLRLISELCTLSLALTAQILKKCYQNEKLKVSSELFYNCNKFKFFDKNGFMWYDDDFMHGFVAGCEGITALEKRRNSENRGWLRLRS